MDLTYPPEAEGFRGEVRAWLAANLPIRWFDDGFALTDDERRDFEESWPKVLAAGGWLCPAWPKKHGGRGLSVMEEVVLHEEFADAGVPLRRPTIGSAIVGPTLMRWGTEAQQRRFLPRIMHDEMVWCQGFSEPAAGSDLAALRTTAVPDGDEWVINGQKVWTTQAHVADHCVLLARTSPDKPKHQGISFLLVPMHQPAIEVRPLTQIDGSADFNELFFTDARCPKDAVVGGVDNGWKVAMTSLSFERRATATTSHRAFEQEIATVVEHARANRRIEDPMIRQRIARQWSRVQILRINGLRILTDVLHGTAQATAVGGLHKATWSELHRDTMELAVDVLGAHGQVLDAVPGARPRRRRSEHDYPVTQLHSDFFFSRAATIWGGTAEIQRNLVAERVLGLPREPGGAS